MEINEARKILKQQRQRRRRGGVVDEVLGAKARSVTQRYLLEKQAAKPEPSPRAKRPQSPRNTASCKRWQRQYPEKRMFSSAKTRAKANNLTFSLALAHIIIPSHCPVLGIELVWSDKRTDNTPSLDRMDNSRGYEPGNVSVISWKANRMKSHYSLEEFKRLVEWLEKH